MKCLAICVQYSVDVLITYKERTFVEHFATYLAFFQMFLTGFFAVLKNKHYL